MIWHVKPTQELIDSFPFKKHMGQFLDIVMTEVGDDYLVARMPVDERTIQPFGFLHGGASCVLAETVGSVAANFCINPATHMVMGLEINANHIKAMRKGYVYGTARPLHIGKASQVWEIRITNEAKQLVCISRLTVAVRDRPRGDAE